MEPNGTGESKQNANGPAQGGDSSPASQTGRSSPPPPDPHESGFAGPAPTPPEVVTVNNWENETGIAGIIDAVRDLLFKPHEFFRGIDPSRPMGRALLLALICYAIGGVSQAGWNAVYESLGMAFSFGQQSDDALSRALGNNFKVIQLVLMTALYLVSPILSIIGAYILGALMHLFLVLFGAGEGKYPATVRALLYSSAPSIFLVFPCCGALVAGIWSIVISIIGLTTLHKAEPLPVIAAYICTFVLLCCCVAGVVFGAAVLMGGSIAALMSQMPNPGRI